MILGVRSNVCTSVGTQIEILRRFENGEKKSHIARDLRMSESTVRSIIKRKEKLDKYKHINEIFGPSISISHQTRTRSSAIETMERLLVTWIENCNQQNVRLDMPKIQAKAKEFYHKIKNEQDFSEMTQKELKESFQASKGWFERFKRRTGVILYRSLDDQSGHVSKRTFTAMKD